MKRLLFALIISMATVVYGQNSLIGNYKLIAIQDKTTNTLDSTRQEHGLTINFETETKFTFNLSINRCMGSYHHDNVNINLKPGGCTEICCDTKLAEEFDKILGEIDRFRINKDDLILENLSRSLYLIKIE